MTRYFLTPKDQVKVIYQIVTEKVEMISYGVSQAEQILES